MDKPSNAGDSASAEGTNRPFWSVVIPAFRPLEIYLRPTIESILRQDPGPEQMQIHVVDDSSPDVDVHEMVRKIAGDRIELSRTPKNLGIAGCWNTCIERARGQWIHLLHADDFVLPGFYEKTAAAAARHPEVSFIAARSFFINQLGTVWKISERIPELEDGGRDAERFYYGTPVQCPGVVVKKSFYQKHGGFQPNLNFVTDCEMWSRVISAEGGLVLSDVLACYRTYDGGTTSRLERTAENLRDLDRLHEIFAAQHPKFSKRRAVRRACYRARKQADWFIEQGDAESTRTNLDYWNANSTPSIRLRYYIGKWLRKLSSKG